MWLSLRNLNAEKWDLLKKALGQAKLLIVFPVLFLMLASHWFRAIRWKMLIEPLGYKPGNLNTFFGVMVGYFVNLGAPRLGEIIKCTVLARYEKIPADKLVGTIVAERAFDLVCLVLVTTTTIILQFDTIGAFAMETIEPLYQSKSGQFSVTKILIILGVSSLNMTTASTIMSEAINVARAYSSLIGLDSPFSFFVEASELTATMR